MLINHYHTGSFQHHIISYHLPAPNIKQPLPQSEILIMVKKKNYHNHTLTYLYPNSELPVLKIKLPVPPNNSPVPDTEVPVLVARGRRVPEPWRTRGRQG